MPFFIPVLIQKPGEGGTPDESTEGRLVMKKGGKLVNSPAREVDGDTHFDQSIKVPPNSLQAGEAQIISAASVFPLYTSNVTGLMYHGVVYITDETGTQKSFRIFKNPQSRLDQQPDFSSIVLTPLDVTFPVTSIDDKFINQFILKTNPNATLYNLCLRLVAQPINKPIFYYPSEICWLSGEGTDVTADSNGDVFLDISQSPLAVLDGQVSSVTIRIDSGIVFGTSGGIPYQGALRQTGHIVNIVDVDDITAFGSGEVITDEERTKLENISDNSAGDSWVSGLAVTEQSPKDQTILYGAGTYLINGISKAIAFSGSYDLTTAYSGMIDDQHAFVNIYVDNDEVIKSLRGDIGEKGETIFPPLQPADTVCVAIVEIKVDKNDLPKDIGNKEIDDCRNAVGFNTDESVAVSVDDLTTGHLFDKLSSAGNVTFEIENPGGAEKVKANVSAGFTIPKMSVAPTANIDGIDVSSLSPLGILKVTLDANREFRSLQGGTDGDIVIIQRLDVFTLKCKNDTGIYQKLHTPNAGDYSLTDYGGMTIVYDGASDYWTAVGGTA